MENKLPSHVWYYKKRNFMLYKKIETPLSSALSRELFSMFNDICLSILVKLKDLFILFYLFIYIFIYLFIYLFIFEVVIQNI